MNPQPAPASVLIADADPYICRVFEAKLSKEQEQPFRAVSVTTGQEALLAGSQNVFSAILWDMRLRDSQRVLPRMRALSPEAVFLLLTTDDRPTLDSELARLDIADILVKPLNLDTLVDRVRAALAATHVSSLSSPMDVSRVGQRLEVASKDGICVTRVLENRQDTFTVVGAPRVRVPADFSPGLAVEVSIAGEDAIYCFSTCLLREMESPVESWEMQKPTSIERIQRRRVPRQVLSFPITLEPLAGESPDASIAVASERAIVDGQTEDVSITGCALVADIALPAGTQVQFVMTPTADDPIAGSGTIVRTSAFALAGNLSSDSVYRLAVQFDDLPPTSRDHLRDLLFSPS